MAMIILAAGLCNFEVTTAAEAGKRQIKRSSMAVMDFLAT